MNRRSFIAALAGFAILPPATTYARIWKATRILPVANGGTAATPVPFWYQTKIFTHCYDDAYINWLTHARIQALTPSDFESLA